MKKDNQNQDWYDNILEFVGHTPLVKLNKLSKAVGTTVLAKLEYFNPGHSTKDRVALNVVTHAEMEGKISPGGTIIEASSGNTGFSLAMVAAIKGYDCIICIPDKSAQEKVKQLRAMGAKVIVCPSKVKADHPESYYSRAAAFEKEIPNSIYINQYFNVTNALAHYNTTGPEIYRQTGGRITHYIASCGTGGTLSGTGRYLKERNRNIKVIGVDAYGSVLKKFHETGELDPKEAYSYKLEGVGKKIIPGNVAFDIIDEFVKVEDDASAHQVRQIAKDEGIFAGYSSGAVIQAVLDMKDRWKPSDLIVVIFPDHGSKYISKIYDDQWMEDQGFLPKSSTESTSLDSETSSTH